MLRIALMFYKIVVATALHFQLCKAAGGNLRCEDGPGLVCLA